MHKFAEQIMECVKTNVNARGIDNISLEELTELELWTRTASNCTKYDYNKKIIEAMEESVYGQDYDYRGKKQYTEHMRNGRRYMHNEPMRDDMMYDDRMDEWKHGRMHYSEEMPESDYDRTRRAYTESKMLSPQDKQMHLKKLTDHLDVFSTDVRDIKGNLTPEERTMWKQKLTNLANEM